MKKETQITGNTGMYYACYKLSEIGYNVMPTARNAKGVDIVAYTPDAKKYLGFQVKTVSKRWGVPLGKNGVTNSMADYWIVVVLDGHDDHPDCYVMKPGEVRNGVFVDSKGNSCLEAKKFATLEYLEWWDRIRKGK